MKRPRWSVVLFSSCSRRLELRLSPFRLITYAIIPVLGLLLLAASVPLFSVRKPCPAGQIDLETALLLRSLDHLDDRLSHLEKEVGRVIALDEKVRVVCDLEIIAKEVRELGIGGTDWHLKQPEAVTPKFGNKLTSVGERIETLKRQIRFEQESYEEIVNSLSERQIRLAHTPSIMPARGFVTSYYGWRKHPLTGQSEFHRGLDVANLVGTPVVATADGKISFAGWKGGFGRVLEIDHGYGYVTRYGHLKSILARVGDTVFRGQTVGLLGSSGNATGPHVHYEVLIDGKHTNPKAYIRYAGLF
jgi:hypothetical protein